MKVPKPKPRGPKPRKPIKRGKRPQPRSIKEHRKLEKVADDLWARIVRSKSPTCAHCDLFGIMPAKKTTDAMHLVSRRYRQTRWLLENGAPGARGCHHIMGFDQHLHVLFCEGYIGKAKWEQLNVLKHCRGKLDMKAIIVALEHEAAQRGLLSAGGD